MRVKVAFFAFVLGVFFSFGSYIILLTNDIMLGANGGFMAKVFY